MTRKEEILEIVNDIMEDARACSKAADTYDYINDGLAGYDFDSIANQLSYLKDMLVNSTVEKIT